jgi:hypothetical protein
MKIAQAKLLCKESTSPPPKLSKPQIFALLGPIIQPQILKILSLNSELVSSHAAHCLNIHSNCDWVISDYPSQFI